MLNHIDIGKVRYKADEEYETKLKPELIHSMKLIKKYLDNKEIEYNYAAVDIALSST